MEVSLLDYYYILFTFQKTYEEKFPKMAKNEKMTLNLEMSKNDKKLPIKFTFL
jgi:hypothetical protein